MLRPDLPRTIAGVLTRSELLVTANSTASAASPGSWTISQTAVPPMTICRRSQRSANADEVTDAAVDTVICRDFVTVPKVAETIAQPFMIGEDVNENVAPIEPAGTVMEAGRLKPVLVDFKPTIDAFTAAEVKVTVHVPPRPGATAVGEQAKRASEDADGERTMGKDTTVCPT
ncbi:MAG: hypothetical protein JWO19_2354 [Bryobacterales bacterium]|nr:hypothetical protein [Bryobacterales bacterium]